MTAEDTATEIPQDGERRKWLGERNANKRDTLCGCIFGYLEYLQTLNNNNNNSNGDVDKELLVEEM